MDALSAKLVEQDREDAESGSDARRKDADSSVLVVSWGLEEGACGTALTSARSSRQEKPYRRVWGWAELHRFGVCMRHLGLCAQHATHTDLICRLTIEMVARALRKIINRVLRVTPK